MTLARTDGRLDPIQMTLDSVASPLTREVYRKALEEFFSWWGQAGRPVLVKAVLQDYVNHLRGRGLGASTINVKLSAIRKMVRESADNGMLDGFQAESIARVKGVQQQGKKSGLWLTKAEAQSLLLAPNLDTLTGLRDRALLAVMLGCGLRRSEVTALSFSHLQQREGRWVVLDLLGKKSRTRTVPMPVWARAAVDDWATASGLSAGAVFRPTTPRGDHLTARVELSHEAVSAIVAKYGSQIGHPDLSPHDLRRTFAKLAHKGKAPLDQIQLSLGHASIVTTEIYLGVSQNLEEAPCDVLGLSLKG